MILHIKQSGKVFRYRRRSYETPLTFPFSMEYISNIVTQLYKQNIIDYIITPDSLKVKNIDNNQKRELRIEYEVSHTKHKNIHTNDNDDIKELLTTILQRTNKLDRKIDNISINNVTVSHEKFDKKKKRGKDTVNTFIPQIDTKGMGIKTNIKTEKSNDDSSASADILRQLLKGI